MRRLIRSRPSPAIVIASIALLVALGGTSIAAVTAALPNNSVGTLQLKGNAVISSKIKNGQVKPADLSASAKTSGPAGPQGPQGPAGAAGPAGATGPSGPAGSVTKLWAVINASGSLARSQGTTSAGRIATGAYEVIFNQDVTNCAFIASLGSAALSAPPGEIAAARRSGNANGVFVQTRDSAGAADDKDFHLAVFC